MLVCILSMCTVGSYAAYLAGNVVLGGFTLFQTFCIGIRFLVKPDTSRENTAPKGEKLDWKGVLISLFFGLTIGFGTGFVGTGGGMMMLVVFTAFLGMELKTAVGTSTFIMTFTALIASIAHIFIHPAIILEKWDVMLICITIATITSLFSARFANRVKGRTVGLVTGAVLTVLGAAMIFLNYRDFFLHNQLIIDTAATLGSYLVYILSLASFLPSSYISRIRVVSRSSRPMCTFRLGLKTKISPDSSSDSIKSSVSLYRLYRVSMHSTYAGYLRYIHLKNGGISRFFRYPATWVTTTTVRVYPRLRKNDTGILSDVPPSRSL